MMNNRNILLRSLLTGFVGGVFWCLIALVASYFKVIDLSPKYYLQMFLFKKKWLMKWYGTILTVVIYGLISAVIAYVYYLLLRKVDGMLIGVMFGIGLAAFFLFVFPQISQDIPQLLSMSKRSITANSCILILYGTFIGYSISFDYRQMRIQLEKK